MEATGNAVTEVTYLCGACGQPNGIKPNDPIRCRFCGYLDVTVTGNDATNAPIPGVELKAFGYGEKILVASRNFLKNEVLIGVSKSMCLLANRDGSVFSGLLGQIDASFDDVGDLRMPLTDEQISTGRTWDVNLALALLDATAGTSVAESGEFYDDLAKKLVQPQYLTLPSCMTSVWMLEQLQNKTMKDGALAQQQRLNRLSALWSNPKAHRITAASSVSKLAKVEEQSNAAFVSSPLSSASPPPLSPSNTHDDVCTPLQWAFALVRSRCFKVSEDVFAFVPLIDMANHDFQPSARFRPADAELSGFVLQSTRDLSAGEEITICYDPYYDNDRLFVQYGFVLPGNPNDIITAWPSEFCSPTFNGITEEVKQQACERILSVTSGAGITTNTKNNVKDTVTTTTTTTTTTTNTHVITKSLIKRISDLSLSTPSPVISQTGGNTMLPSSVHDQLCSLWDELTLELNQIRDSFPTSLASDCKLMDKLNALPADTVYVSRGEIDPMINDPHILENVHQMKACLRYRIVKKQMYDDVNHILDKCR